MPETHQVDKYLHERSRAASHLCALIAEARTTIEKLERAADDIARYDDSCGDGQLSTLDADDLLRHIEESARALRDAERITTAHNANLTQLMAGQSPPEPPWRAIADAVTIQDVVEAVRSDRPEWYVSELIEKAVRVALALPAATQP